MLIVLYIIEILFWLLVADIVMLVIVFRKDLFRNKDGIFTRIDKLTNKALREAHNIMKMYIAGSFNGK